MFKKLMEILENIEYAGSDLYSATENLPDYQTNSSSRDYMSGAESYLENARYEIEKVISTLKELEY